MLNNASTLPRQVLRRCLALVLLLPFASAQAELLGYIGGQLRWFPETALDSDQGDTSASLVLAPEWYSEFNDRNDSINLKLFYRYDSMDSERSHGDIRELYWLHVGSDWEFTLGLNKIFWGVTESQHLVDIINQTDFVEAPDGDEKLGQAMAHLALIKDWGVLDLFALPGFRPMTFAGKDGRLRSIPVTIADKDSYEDSRAKDHVDFAARWSHYIGNLNFGLSWFNGTGREPLFRPTVHQGQTALQPHYVQIQQLGLDTQYIVGDASFKLEAIRREYDTPLASDYTAVTAGVEHTLVGVRDTIFDLGLLAEYSYDSRPAGFAGRLQNDLLLGGRLAFNDIASSEMLFGVIQDLDETESRAIFLESSTRIGDRTKVSIEASIINSNTPQSDLYLGRRDSYLEFSAEYYF